MLHLPFGRHREDHSLVLGKVAHFPLLPPVRIPGSARRAHLYVVGLTGRGKSKLLEHCLLQDIAAGRGCVLIDPHGDLVNDVLRYGLSRGVLSDQDAPRIIYFDPTRRDYILPFNVLAGGGDAYTIAQRVIEAFRRTWPESLAEAPQFSNIAAAALITLAENRRTLMEMDRVLTDQAWRERLLVNVSSPQVVSFFRERYDQWGREAPRMRESTLNKVAAFSFNPHLRLVLGQKENRLDLRSVMDEGNVLLVNLGRCDGETQRLLGSLLVTGLEQAAASRQDLPSHQRTPCYAYIDEFQDFSANVGSVKSLAKILSECRKFGLHLTLAHQNLSQIGERMLGAIGNIQTKVIFGIDRYDAEYFAKVVGSVNTEAVKRDPKTETQHELFSPLPEQWEKITDELRSQPPRRAVVSGINQAPVRIRTMDIPPYTVSEDELEAFRRSSSAYHGIAHEAAQHHLALAHRQGELADGQATPTFEPVTSVPPLFTT